jgi:hypothetical protein
VLFPSITELGSIKLERDTIRQTAGENALESTPRGVVCSCMGGCIHPDPAGITVDCTKSISQHLARRCKNPAMGALANVLYRSRGENSKHRQVPDRASVLDGGSFKDRLVSHCWLLFLKVKLYTHCLVDHRTRCRRATMRKPASHWSTIAFSDRLGADSTFPIPYTWVPLSTPRPRI